MKPTILKKLKEEYIDLIRRGHQIQRSGDIRAFTLHAIKAESLAAKMQRLSRDQ
jgi:hypothetical protein